MKKLSFLFLFVVLFSSCESYLDVNESQTNRAEFEALSPAQLLAGAINGYTNYQNISLNTYGNRGAYVWGLNFGYTGTDALYDYNVSSADYNNNFEAGYLNGDNFQDILDKQANFPDYALHFGVAKVFKVMCLDYVTAIYGDTPYSEAFKENISSPKYDDDKAIIPALLAELDDARTYLNSTSSTLVPLGSEDTVFAGDVSLWIKFVNTVELRLLMRLSNTTDPALVTLRNTRFAALDASQDFIAADVRTNPGYNSSTTAQRSPFYRVYGLNDAFDAFTDSNRSNAAGDYMAKLVNGTINNADITTAIVDPRRSRMFNLVGGVVTGSVQNSAPAVTVSRVSSFFTGRAGANADADGCSRDAYLMLNAESQFLQAEAFQRGYLTGNAQVAFTAGITASFNFYSRSWGSSVVSVLNPVTYIAATDAKNGLGWTGSANKINAITTQKYLALANWSGVEVFLQHLRTGFPALPLPPGAAQTRRPYRMIYPTSEYSSNSANAINVTSAECFTVNSKTPYIYQ
ncbi:SusD/RagB family nutrient-binding outer membrane lipoprotein [Flavobacterium sp.]|uniref:SusD/RagB family nutrient-binding outer membrane lipoprotein n=1 Tax=Flavobacterium sp. TaxID=239 RepID=UPI003751E55F